MPIIEAMSRTVNCLLVAGLALAMAGCLTPSNQQSTTGATVGNSSAADYAATSYTPPSTTHPPPLKNAQVNQLQSQALTNYLKAHHLPLVGAQVLSAPNGQRQVILFGFVATDYGKGDAESKARRYINDPAVTVDNRIKIEPSLANAKGSDSGSQGADQDDLSGLEAYENQRYENQLQQQQLYGYQNQGPSPMTMSIPLLGGFFGGSFGGGSFGFGSGGFGPGFYSMPPPVYRTYPPYP